MASWPAVVSLCSRSNNPEVDVANQLGKRFQCEVCNTEVLCIKAGDGAVDCCGKPMELMQPKVLPSAD